MSIAKIMGLETEYGVIVRGNENPDLGAELLLRAYQQGKGPFVPSRSPFFPSSPGRSGNREWQESIMLSNGARFYIDHTHPEYATPECLSPRQLVAADKAGERILAQCRRQVKQLQLLSPEEEILLYKNNSDHKGKSYGCHDNYLLEPGLFEPLVAQKEPYFSQLLTFLVTRSLLCGAGKVGSENNRAPAGFQLSQRADFFEVLSGPQTTYQRPLFNTRDEAHAARSRFRRLHLITADANMAEFSTYLKVGTTQLVLQLLEDNLLPSGLVLAEPLTAFRNVSLDLSFTTPLRLKDGRTLTAVEIQQVYLETAERFLADRKDESGEWEGQWEVWKEWAHVLEKLPANWQSLATRLDWAIKRYLLERYLGSQQTTWEDAAAWQPVIELTLFSSNRGSGALKVEKEILGEARQMAEGKGYSWSDYEKQREIYFALRRLDRDYHEIRQETASGGAGSGLFYRLQASGAIDRLCPPEEIEAAIVEPPVGTRGRTRGDFIQRFAPYITSADWSILHFQKENFPGKKGIIDSGLITMNKIDEEGNHLLELSDPFELKLEEWQSE